jgi:penicillin-binding protein 1A
MKVRRLIIFISGGLLLIPFLFFIWIYSVFYYEYSKISDYRPGLSTKLYDTEGALISELYEEYRTFTPAAAIPEIIKQGFIAAEDRNFYSHRGVDLAGILRAAIVDIASGSIKQGGSTITQQTVKQLYTGSRRSFTRKLTELLIAREMERSMTKEQILEIYLNQIYFGHGIYGVESACRFFLNMELKEAGPLEAALLASIPSAPDRYSPLRRPSNLYEKHKRVLYSMVSCGFADKSALDMQFRPFWEKLILDNRERYEGLGIRDRRYDLAPHFTEHIRRLLVEKYGEDGVYRGGLKVYTTLNLAHQKSADQHLEAEIARQNTLTRSAVSRPGGLVDMEIYSKIKAPGEKSADTKAGVRAVSELRSEITDELSLISLLLSSDAAESAAGGLSELNAEAESGVVVQGAFISMDHKTGAVTAMIGGSGFSRTNQLNRAVQSLRQPGSSFKIYVYGAAIDSGRITAATMYIDAPITYRSRKRIWSPENYDNSFRGDILTRDAFAISLNIVPILIFEDLGGSEIIKFTSKLTGAPEKRFQNDATTAIGSSELTPMEMIAGTAVYANGGYKVEPRFINKIIDRDEKVILETPAPSAKREMLLKPGTAFIMTELMRSVVEKGTANYAVKRAAGYTGPAAGKTGTNTEYRDAWFTGFTPDLTAVVWLGCDSPKHTLSRGQTGSSSAAPVWGRFMKDVTAGGKTGRFAPPPANIVTRTVCASTGLLPAEGCSRRTEYFIKGTEPEETCDSLHYNMSSVMGLYRQKSKNDGRESKDTTNKMMEEFPR